MNRVLRLKEGTKNLTREARRKRMKLLFSNRKKAKSARKSSRSRTPISQSKIRTGMTATNLNLARRRSTLSGRNGNSQKTNRMSTSRPVNSPRKSTLKRKHGRSAKTNRLEKHPRSAKKARSRSPSRK